MNRFASVAAALLLISLPCAVFAQAEAQAPTPAPAAPSAPEAPAAPPPAPAPPVPEAPTPPAALLPPPAPVGSVALVYKFTQGEILRYHMTTSTTGSISAAGQPIALSTTLDTSFTYSVTSVDASGDGTIAVAFQDTTMNMSMNGQSMPAPQSMLDQLAAGSIIVMSPQGKIISMKYNAPSSATAPMDPSQSMMSPSSMSAYSAFPDHAVKIGDVWRSTVMMPRINKPMYIKMSLVGLDNSSGPTVATIASKFYGDLVMNATASTPVSMTGVLTGTGKNTFDADRGVLTGMTTTMNMDMSMLPPASSAASVGKMSSHLVITVNMDLVNSQ